MLRSLIPAIFIALFFFNQAFAQLQSVGQEEGTEIMVVTPEQAAKLSLDKSEKQVLTPNDYKELVRVEHVHFSSPQRGNGQQTWVLYRNRINEKWEFLARIDNLNRYDLHDRSTSVGAVYHQGPRNIRIEVSYAAHESLFPTSSIEVEYVTPLTKKLVGYIGGRYSRYDQSGISNVLGFLAAEYYLAGYNMIYARLFLSHDQFNSGPSQNSVTALLRFTHFINDFDRVWVYAANGSDTILRTYNNSVESAKGVAVGAGLSKQLGSTGWTVELNFEISRRNLPGGPVTDKSVMVALVARWK